MESKTSHVVYSKRLTSLTAHIVFVSLGLFEAATVVVIAVDHPLVRLVYLPILPFYFLIGTYGWHWTQRHGRYQGAYFVIMTLLGSVGGIVASLALGGMVGLLSILMLIMQAAVLEKWRRVLFIAAVVITTAFIAVVTGSAFGLTSWLTFLSAISAVLAFSFFGDVIVREEKARAQLARYAEQVEELAAARERNRIAREIHDNLGHYLTAINMQAQAAQAILSKDPQVAANALGHIQDLAREGLTEARKSITALRELPLERRTLHEAVDTLLGESRARGLAVDFRTMGNVPPPQTEIDMTIYRVIQESLTNIHKHAHASHASIALSYANPSAIHLSICDDGVGNAAPGQGFGLLGLRERVGLVGGTFTTRSAAGEGFCIEVEIPR
jgi:signal transduction histidine kinase